MSTPSHSPEGTTIRRPTPLFLALPLLLPIACGGDEEPLGTASPMPAVGAAFSVDIQSGEWQQPANVGGIVNIVAGDYPFFVGVFATTDATMDLVLAVADGEGQQMCNRTVVMPGVSVTDGRSFAFGPSDFTIANGIRAEQLEIKGTFGAGFGAITGIEMKGHVVVATIPEDILTIPSADVCDNLALADIPCETCPSGDGQCIATHVTGMQAVLAADVTVQEITVADCHAECTAPAEDADCPEPAGS